MKRLRVSVGQATHAGRRARNEDFPGVATPEHLDLDDKGVLVAVADGVSGHEGGREASEYLVRNLLADYYATPPTWSAQMALDKVIGAANEWLIAQATRHKQFAGMASTLSALVLCGVRFVVAHVGDSRIYRLRDGEWSCLTRDHVWDRPDMRHVLKRAVGLDRRLTVDYADGALQAGDRFVLCSDGVWGPLAEADMIDIVAFQHDAQVAAQALVDGALSAGGDDNATALVVDVFEIPARSWRDVIGSGALPPVPARLKPGQVIDDFEVLELVHESRATLLYRVRAQSTGQVLALKTLQPAFADDRASCEGLLAEEWLSKRIVSPYFPQVLPLPATARGHLYYVMSFHAGASLQRQLDRGRHFSIPAALGVAHHVVKGLGALHRLSIVHRDIKPANILECDDGGMRILDLGVALAAGVPYPELSAESGAATPGTPSYMAPELFAGQPASVRSDIYALGVTLYHLLTRKYPYGEIEPFQTPRFGDPVPPTRYRPDVPAWLEALLMRAIARNPERRFDSADAFLAALERADRAPSPPPQPAPIASTSLSRWQSIAIALLFVNVLLLYVLVMR